ncbi:MULTISPECIES: hypothetical protein [Burkholderia]
MEELGITIEALAESIEHDVKHQPIYRDARGNEWNGEGDAPDWLQAAQNAGVDPDFFRIAPSDAARRTPLKVEAEAGGTDRRQLDLFA